MSLGILCPGQGAQHPGMLDLVRGEPEAERVLALASAVLDAPIADLLSGPAERRPSRPRNGRFGAFRRHDGKICAHRQGPTTTPHG